MEKPWSEEVQRRWSARRELWNKAFSGIDLAGKKVLDAGTGEGHFCRFLAERNPGQLVSLTCLEDEIEPTKARLGELAASVQFQVANVAQMPEIPDGSFDLVGADFLIAAVASYSPFKEVDCLKELARVLQPGGRLIVTGWEIGRRPMGPTAETIQSLSWLRDAADHLRGLTPFREHPSSWVVRRLTDLGLPAERIELVLDVHRDFRWFIASVRRSIAGLDPGLIRQGMEDRLAELERQILSDPSFETGYPFGRLYAVVACKLQGGVLLTVAEV